MKQTYKEITLWIEDCIMNTFRSEKTLTQVTDDKWTTKMGGANLEINKTRIDFTSLVKTSIMDYERRLKEYKFIGSLEVWDHNIDETGFSIYHENKTGDVIKANFDYRICDNNIVIIPRQIEFTKTYNPNMTTNNFL